MKYTFWNNKGGTGKSSLAFQTITEYAILHPTKKILAIDLCPQANLSELFMGGLLGNGGTNLNNLTTATNTCTIGGYFQDRLSNPYNVPAINSALYTSNPSAINDKIPVNIDLIAGDRIVELQSNSISALSITQIPGVDTYLKIIDWVNDLINAANIVNNYDDIFLDTNPSFAICQIGKLSTQEVQQLYKLGSANVDHNSTVTLATGLVVAQEILIGAAIGFCLQMIFSSSF